MESTLSRKLAVVLYADVAGYSRLTAQDEDGTHRRLSGALDSIASMVSALRGRVVHYAGDAVLAEFATAADALTCSILIQRSLKERNAPLTNEQRLSFRIGLNLGDVIDDRSDIYGDGVNIAARLEAIAKPGGICVSDAVRTAVGARVPVEFKDLGLCEVKNIPEPVHVWEVHDVGLETADEGSRYAAVLIAHARAAHLLTEQESEVDTRSVLDRGRGVVASTMESRGGRIIETPGDTVVAEFKEPALCIDCAQATRTAIMEMNVKLQPAQRVHYRFGIAFGTVVEGREGLGGDAAKRAAWLAARAGSDEIRLDDDVLGQLPAETELSLSDVEPGVRAITFDAPSQTSKRSLPQIDGLDLPLPAKPSIALLPFRCLGDDQEGAALADGIRLDIQNSLVQSSALLVIAAGSTNAFRGFAGEQAAPLLGVRHVLEGTVRRSGPRVRVSVELTDAEASSVIWSERYDRVIDDTFTLQDEIAEHVVTALDVRLSSGEQARIWRKCLTNAKARERFYSGIHAFFQMNAESIARARAHFERVAAMLPDSPLGPTWVAMCHWFEATRGWSSDAQASRRHAGEWAERAARLEDADGQAQTVLGNVRLLEGRFDEALAIAREAVKIRPGCTNANGFLANVLLHCGEFDDAIAHAKHAIRLSPVYPPWFLEILAAAYRDSNRVGFAISVARELLRIAPASLHGRLLLASALVRGAWLSEARGIAREVADDEPGFSSTRFAQALPYRDKATIARIAEELTMIGLPD